MQGTGSAGTRQSSPLPAYHKIANMLGSRIMTGYYAPGSRLGTEKDMAETFGVSRITIRQAFDLLERQQLIERRRAKGTFAASRVKPRASVELNGLLDDILLQAESGSTVFVERQFESAPPRVAEKLGIAPGSRIDAIRRVQVTRTEPHLPKAWLINYFPLNIGQKYTNEALHSNSVLQLLDNDPATRLGEGIQEIRASAADAETARHLEIAPGTPVLVVERVVYSERGEPLEFAIINHRRDQMAFDVHLDRIQT